MLGIVASRADTASMHIADCLRDIADWEEAHDESRADSNGGGTVFRLDDVELRTFDDIHLELENPAAAFDEPELLVFVSRHAGDTGPLLTAHFTGNAGAAEYGGEAGALAVAAPGAHTAVIEGLVRHAPAGYEVGMECTHHGPSAVGAPSMFVEVGSDEAQWNDRKAAEAVARAVLALEAVEPRVERTIVGFGGGHYAPRFERIVRETDWAVGHVIADWGLEAMDALPATRQRSVIESAFERSGATRAVIIGDHPDIVDMVADVGFDVVSETWVRETDGVDLALVERLETELVSVDDGLRFGEPASAWNAGEIAIYRPDPALLEDATGVDREATRRTVATHALAYETVDEGTTVAGRVAIEPPRRDDLLEALLTVLDDRFESIDRRGDEVVATERVFDPEQARALGVEPGPDFGRLAAGESVEVDGDEVAPADVHKRRTRRYEP